MKVDRRNKISIRQRVESQNSYGEYESTWNDYKTNIWASKEPILGNEYFAAETIQSKVEVKFRTYYIPGITDKMQIYDEEGIYEILSVINPKSLNRELLFYCKKVI